MNFIMIYLVLLLGGTILKPSRQELIMCPCVISDQTIICIPTTMLSSPSSLYLTINNPNLVSLMLLIYQAI